MSAATYFSRQLQKSHPELHCSGDIEMYHDSPEKAANNGAEQSEAGVLKALLM